LWTSGLKAVSRCPGGFLIDSLSGFELDVPANSIVVEIPAKVIKAL
jgi:acetyltransferase-like isoleucine patch superfamily enzyme